MQKDDAVLHDILNAANLVMDFVRGFDKQTFLDDWKTRSAVLYQLTVIGEAVKRLSQVFRNEHSEIQWSLNAGMRDHLIHGYDLIDWDEAWKTATMDVPDLLYTVERYLG
jgi:uncharacterized protein with HEPN domain